MHIHYWVTIAAALITVAARAPAQPLDSAAVDALVAKAIKAWNVPGVAVVIAAPERVHYIQGHGVRELGKTGAVTPDTLFPISSCTKAYTTTLIATLVDEGKMTWDDPVRKHLPYFHLSEPKGDGDVIIRDLLTHRTGVGSHDYLWYRSPLAVDELVKRAGHLPLDRKFRTAFQYQSVMFTAAGLAASRAGGDDWAALVQKRIFDPLGMATARCRMPDLTPTADVAMPHRPDRAGKLAVIPWYEQKTPNPAGSIHLSARDLVGWLQMQIGDGLYRGRQIVSAAALAETHSPQMVIRREGQARDMNPETHQLSYGLGWVVQDYRGYLLWSHAGAIDGFRVHITLIPQIRTGFAILANRHETRMNLALSNILVDRLMGLSERDWHGYFLRLAAQEEQAATQARRQRDSARRPGAVPPRPLADYSGEYEHPAYGKANIREADGRLVWTWSSFRNELQYRNADVFAIEDADLRDPLLEFSVRDGRVTGFRLFDVTFSRTP